MRSLQTFSQFSCKSKNCSKIKFLKKKEQETHCPVTLHWVYMHLNSQQQYKRCFLYKIFVRHSAFCYSDRAKIEALRILIFIFLLMSRVSVQMFKKSLFFFQCTLHFLCLFFRWVLFLWFVGMVHQIVFHCVFWFYCFLICGNIYPLFSWHSQSLLTWILYFIS